MPRSVSRPTARRTDRGLSLLELLLVMALLAMIGMAAYETVILGLRVATATDEREDIRQQAANAVERFVREAGVADVVDLSTNQQFQFDGDLDGDGTVEASESNVLYRVSGGDFQRVQGAQTLTLIRDLNTLDFDYINAGGTEYDDYDVGCGGCVRTNIRVVQVNVTATQDDETLTTGSAAFLRNNY